MRKSTPSESPNTTPYDVASSNEHPSIAHKFGAIRTPNIGNLKRSNTYQLLQLILR